jgi:hypothetical protein
MIAHSTSKRSAKAVPQVEATVSLSITAKLMKFTARQDFVVGNCHIHKGETAFAVASERRPGRYYIIRFNNERSTYQCSCGANTCEHEHLRVVRQYVMSHVVVPVKVESTPVIPQMTTPLTSAQWREIAKADRKRQQAWQDEYRQQAAALREQSKREMEVAI